MSDLIVVATDDGGRVISACIEHDLESARERALEWGEESAPLEPGHGGEIGVAITILHRTESDPHVFEPLLVGRSIFRLLAPHEAYR